MKKTTTKSLKNKESTNENTSKEKEKIKNGYHCWEVKQGIWTLITTPIPNLFDEKSEECLQDSEILERIKQYGYRGVMSELKPILYDYHLQIYEYKQMEPDIKYRFVLVPVEFITDNTDLIFLPNLPDLVAFKQLIKSVQDTEFFEEIEIKSTKVSH